VKPKTVGIVLAILGLAVIGLSLYQAQIQGEVKIIAWYDMNNDGVINYKDFDVDSSGSVDWVDVTLVQDAASNETYVERYDFNQDGIVDQTDVNIVKQWLGKGTMALYDMNGDGAVDWHDLDVNEDGVVDIMDIAFVARAYGSEIGDEKYDPRLDFNRDGVIDDADINLIKPYFGYPLSLVEVLVNPANPLTQLFILGIIITLLGIVIILRGGK